MDQGWVALQGEALRGERKEGHWVGEKMQSLPNKPEHLVTSVSTALKLWKINMDFSLLQEWVVDA